MEHYSKGRNDEELLTKEHLPFQSLPSQFGWQEITGTSKIKADIGPLNKILKDQGALGNINRKIR